MEINVVKPNPNGIKILGIFNDLQNILKSYIEGFKGSTQDVVIKNDLLSRTYSERLETFLNDILPSYQYLIEENLELLLNDDFSNIIINELNVLRSSVLYSDEKSPKDKIYIISNKINNFISTFDNIRLSIISLQNANAILQTQLVPKIQEVEGKVKDLEAARLAFLGQRTEMIYSAASEKYLKYAQYYDIYFYILLFTASCLTFVSFRHFSYGVTNIVDFVLSKVMILSVVITLGTLFLRKASHLRKQHDQANQTSMELKALPTFINDLPHQDQIDIYKDLASKYFGKELDQTQNDKVGDLMKDQLAAGTELVKASRELLKKP